jgi:hypothetical protein
MAVNHRTCLQVAVSRSSDGTTLDYLTLIRSRVVTVPADLQQVQFDALNFAANDEPTPKGLVTISVDASLSGLAVTLRSGTSLLSTTSGQRELELSGSGRRLLDVRSTLTVEARRAGNWAGPTGDVSILLRRPEDGKLALERTLLLTKDSSTSVPLSLRRVPSGTYLLELKAPGFNAPSHIQILHKRSTPPQFLFVFLGCVLIILGTAKTLAASGRLGRIGLGLLLAVAILLGGHYCARLAFGYATLQPAPTRSSGITETTVMPQQFPAGTIESILDTRRDEWWRGRPGVAYVYIIPRADDESLGLPPPLFRPVCARVDC